jgi:predicted phosphodiesterase
LSSVDAQRLQQILQITLPVSLDIGGNGKNLAIFQSNQVPEKKLLQDKARRILSEGHKIVVFGHTHQPDRMENQQGIYFNPGSWTKYVDLDLVKDLTMQDLEDDSRFPYQLNFIRVTMKKGKLEATMEAFEELQMKNPK